MRTSVRLLSTAVTTATLGSTATFGGLAAGAAAFDDAPLRPATTPATAAPTAAPRYELPGGLSLPHGTVPVAKATESTDARGMSRWEVRLDLGSSTGAQALDQLAAQLAGAHWQIERGAQDLFAARQTDGRWEIVVARWPAPQLESAHTLGIGIGSRPA